MYGQQNYGQRIITPNVINIGQNITYQQFGHHQQQPIYYNQNQVYIGGVYNQQQKTNTGQYYNYQQVVANPGYSNNYQYMQNQQLQNIYQPNQIKNIYQQQSNSHQQAQKTPKMKQQAPMKNQMIQQKPKVQNQQTHYVPTNPNIIQKQIKNIPIVNQSSSIKKEAILDKKPMTKNETDELYSYESAICKINFKTIKNGEIKDGKGTGFFLEINDDNIPFKKALFTNNHVLNKNSIEMNKEIVFEYCNKIKKIKITENRKAFTNNELEYTCIEIFDKDNINNFFRIDKSVFRDKNLLKNKEIFILQYPYGELSHDVGKILDIENNKIIHSVNTEEGSSGSPLIKRYNTNLIIGIHYGSKKDPILNNKYLYNVATPFDVIIKDIKYQLYNNKNIINYINIEYRNKINLIYVKKNNYKGYENPNIIFGSKFVENNKGNIKLIINGIESELIEEYNLKVGVNNIQLIILNKLLNLEYMFKDACSLNNIEELKYLNIKDVNNFSWMFSGCSSLSDIKSLQNWNV